MTRLSLSWSEDLPPWALWFASVLILVALAALVVEVWHRRQPAPAVLLSGVSALALLWLAVLRPARVSAKSSSVGPRVAVLVDRSRRLELPEGSTTRAELARRAASEVSAGSGSARITVLGYDRGPPYPLPPTWGPGFHAESDLTQAVAGLEQALGERPHAVVLLSDGRLTRPGGEGDEAALRLALGGAPPVFIVPVASVAPRDASVRSVRTSGAAVAHQELTVTVEVGCEGLRCEAVPVTLRELIAGAEARILGSGVARLHGPSAVVELSVTLDRAGQRVLEVRIDAPEGDAIPENDRRLVRLTVTRERLRLLHVAGRPTYDVRALRRWLKSNDSVDLVAFFILRTPEDDANTTDDESELALIPFPVDELFTEHLASFDAVILQDIDADAYGVARHLGALAAYVEGGGGLILVGGPSAFAGGGYAGSRLERVLPVELPDRGDPFDTAPFVPRVTEAGSVAPMLRGLRELHEQRLPELPGANRLGGPRPGTIVLWEHPQHRAGAVGMPVLALAEAGDGRSIALGVDGTHVLAFSEFAAESSGRAFGALWEGLLGWLMRDPRFEAARLSLTEECVVGRPVELVVERLVGVFGPTRVTLERLGPTPMPREVVAPESGAARAVLSLGLLEAGGWTARVSIGGGPPVRLDFACEVGGEAWADSRPDLERLAAIARATGGKVLRGAADLPLPAATEVSVERQVSPVAPPWLWSLLAALALSVHWLLRRRDGLA